MTNLSKSFSKKLIFSILVLTVGFFNSCDKEQEQVLEFKKNPTELENLTLRDNTMSGEFVDHILFFETYDFVPHYYVALGISPIAYKLDKQNPATADFIQLIKDAKEGIEPLKVTIDESGNFTKVAKVSEIEERGWRRSRKGKIWNNEDRIVYDEAIELGRLGPINFNNFNEVNNVFQLMNSYRCNSSGLNLVGCIPFDYKRDGCYARAHRMKQLIESNYNKTCNKLFIFGDFSSGNLLDVPGCPNISWLYHVAPYVEASGIGYVIDPSIFNQPVTANTWMASMGINNGCGEVITDGSIYAPHMFASYNCGAGAFAIDPNYVDTYNVLGTYAFLSGC